MAAKKDTRFAGMPQSKEDITQHASSVAGAFRRKYELPKKFLGMRWAKSGLEDQYRTFWLEELTPDMQHHAAKIAKDNASILQQELLFKSIAKIGDRPVASDRDFQEKWYKAIGPKCRMLISTAFGEIVSVDEADTEAFLASGEDDEE